MSVCVAPPDGETNIRERSFPVLVGGGIPMWRAPASRTRLILRNQRLYSKSGIVLLEYVVSRLRGVPRTRSG